MPWTAEHTHRRDTPTEVLSIIDPDPERELFYDDIAHVLQNFDDFGYRRR